MNEKEYAFDAVIQKVTEILTARMCKFPLM